MPIALATGWSSLVLEVVGIPLNPMSATLGALVIAVATEFSVILSARYAEEREAGSSVGEALRLTYARTGAAVLASGVTASPASGCSSQRHHDAPRLRARHGRRPDRRAAGVMLVLPAALVWAEDGFRRSASAVAPRPAAPDSRTPA